MTTQYPTLLERAFALADSGGVRDLTSLRQQLKSEGFQIWQLTGPALMKQLRARIEKARPALEPAIMGESSQ